MYVILERDPDGERNTIHTDYEVAKSAYDKGVENLYPEENIYLAEVEPGSEFGFGARGDFYGGTIIEQMIFEG